MKLKGKYRNNIEPKYVNGVYGGRGIDNEVVIHFYHESFSLPEGFDLEIVNEELDENAIWNDVDINREIKSTVILSISSAKELYNWLGKVLNDREQLSQDDGDSNDEY